MAVIDYDDFLDRIYDTTGISASLDLGTSGTFDLTVVNKSEGVLLESGHGLSLATSKPAVCVRGSELAEKGLVPADIKGGVITFNSQAAKIAAIQPKPKPNGLGEFYLILQEV